jgi:hypothetical protein
MKDGLDSGAASPNLQTTAIDPGRRRVNHRAQGTPPQADFSIGRLASRQALVPPVSECTFS